MRYGGGGEGGQFFLVPYKGSEGLGPGGGLATYTHMHYRLD